MTLNSYSSSISIDPVSDLSPSTGYTIRIGTTVKSATGLSLEQPYEFSFRTGPFRILSTSPSGGSTGVGRNARTCVYTTATLNTNAIDSSLLITPPTLLRSTVTEGNSYFYFVPRTPYAPLTTYTVTVTPELHSKWGVLLPAPHTFSFTTGSSE